jgi:hypothetical protein
VKKEKEFLEIENPLSFETKRMMKLTDFTGLEINENVFTFEKKLDVAELVHGVGGIRRVRRGHFEITF